MPERGEVYRAGTPALGARLAAAASLVRRGQAAADIGCDHGKLAVYLARRGICPRVIAVDSRVLPLAKARALSRQAGCAGAVDCRLGEGLAPLAPLEAGDIVIAGLSGESIAGILAACGWVKDAAVRLILAPATKHAALRRFLCEAGFALEREVPVAERGRPYAVMQAAYTGRPFVPGDAFCETGLVPRTPCAAAELYIEKRLADLRNRGAAPLSPGQRARHDKLVKEVETCLR